MGWAKGISDNRWRQLAHTVERLCAAAMSRSAAKLILGSLVDMLPKLGKYTTRFEGPCSRAPDHALSVNIGTVSNGKRVLTVTNRLQEVKYKLFKLFVDRVINVYNALPPTVKFSMLSGFRTSVVQVNFVLVFLLYAILSNY